MRPLILSAAVFATMLLPVSSASAADYTVPRSASGYATTRDPNSAIESAGASARGAVLAAGVDCVGWRHKILRLEQLPSVALYSATVEASAICVS